MGSEKLMTLIKSLHLFNDIGWTAEKSWLGARPIIVAMIEFGLLRCDREHPQEERDIHVSDN